MVYQGESTRSFPGRDFRPLIIFLAAASFVSSVDMSWRSRCWSGGGLEMLSPQAHPCGDCGEQEDRHAHCRARGSWSHVRSQFQSYYATTEKCHSTYT